MSDSGTLHFQVQVATPDNEARATETTTRDLLHELREARLAAVYWSGMAEGDRGGGEPLRLGTLKAAVDAVALPRFLEFTQLWAMGRPGLVVRLRLGKVGAVGRSGGASERHAALTLRGQGGQPEDVDALMEVLDADEEIATAKLVDFALSLVQTAEGQARLRHYLCQGSLTQRNYAALYFKRLGQRDVLEDAVARGCVSADLAFNR
ncbi:MAG: hypothetical protein KIS91_07685 [Anaerolineae bacterium]|nr:hypothetical protein [Anaerolineae bacterium]